MGPGSRVLFLQPRGVSREFGSSCSCKRIVMGVGSLATSSWAMWRFHASHITQIINPNNNTQTSHTPTP
eukprot:12927141-Prorocentrum_lima.AAC.1